MVTTVTSDYRYNDYTCTVNQVTIVTMITAVTSDYRYHDYNCNKWLS